MIYLDTSVLVSSLTAEPATSRVQAWLRTKASERLCISPWVITEINSALAMKLRLGIVTAAERTRIIHEFEYLKRQKLDLLEVQNVHFFTAASYVSHHQLKLRAADALHLAIASDNGASLCTLDQVLFDAGKTLGLPAVMP
jgi:uncharacterized protein